METIKRKTKVILLPTEKANPNLFIHQSIGCKEQVLSSEQGIVHHKEMMLVGVSKPQHLYFLSDEEIKEGEKVIFENQIYTTKKDEESSFWILLDSNNKQLPSLKNPKDCRKIISTTDSSLTISNGICDGCDARIELIGNEHVEISNGGKITTKSTHISKSLPQPSPSFIQAYIKAYNEGNPITEVMVEYEPFFDMQDKVTRQWVAESGNVCNKYKLKVDKSNFITTTKIKDVYTEKELLTFVCAYSGMEESKVKRQLDKWNENGNL